MESKSQEISFRRAYLLYFGLLIGAMIATAPRPTMIAVAGWFPLGISALFQNPSDASRAVLIAIGYLVHWVFFFLFAIFRRRPGFYLLCGAFIIFLLLNVAGCHKMLKSFSHIT